MKEEIYKSMNCGQGAEGKKLDTLDNILYDSN